MTIRVEAGDCLEVIPRLVAEGVVVDAVVTDLAAGLAAEHLVCSDLLLQGYRAFLADQNCSYDVAVEHSGRLVRLQVKATRGPRSVPHRPGSALSYIWHVRRAGKNQKRRYGSSEFDMLALVALDRRVIAYVPISDRVLQSINLRVPTASKSHGNRRNGNIDEFPFRVAFLALP